jgi:hypothetical protein
MTWRKSTYSGDHNCVELACRTTTFSTDHAVAVRDSKNAAGPVLSFGRAEFALFTTALSGLSGPG